MSCAFFLAEMGYENVTVFDKNPVPGGMLTLGIPSFRLEKDVLNAEIDILKEMGVTFKCGIEVGKDITIQQLRDEGYKGFYLAIGAQKSQPLNIAGEDLKGVYGGVDFLREVNLGNKPAIGKKCAVIGGGNVAMDVCRAAVRLGAKDTYIVYRRSADEMPADPEEVREAIEEGVKFRYLSAPVEIEGKDGKKTTVQPWNVNSVVLSPEARLGYTYHKTVPRVPNSDALQEYGSYYKLTVYSELNPMLEVTMTEAYIQPALSNRRSLVFINAMHTEWNGGEA